MLQKIKCKIKIYLAKLIQTSLKTKKFEELKSSGVKIGENVFIGSNVIIDTDWGFLLELNDGCVISSDCIIELHDSSLCNVSDKKALLKLGKVSIGKQAYVGVKSVILPGVSVGEKSIVGACSLINRDVPPGEVWGGVPIKKITTVAELKRKREKQASVEDKRNYFIEYVSELEKKNLKNYNLYKKNKKLELYRRVIGINE